MQTVNFVFEIFKFFVIGVKVVLESGEHVGEEIADPEDVGVGHMVGPGLGRALGGLTCLQGGAVVDAFAGEEEDAHSGVD